MDNKNERSFTENRLADAQIVGKAIDRSKPIGWYCPVCHGQSQYTAWLWPSCKEHLEGTMTRFIPIFVPLIEPESSEIYDEDLDAPTRAVSETKTERIALLSDLGPYGTGQKAERAAIPSIIGDPNNYFATSHGETAAYADEIDEPAAVLFVAEE